MVSVRCGSAGRSQRHLPLDDENNPFHGSLLENRFFDLISSLPVSQDYKSSMYAVRHFLRVDIMADQKLNIAIFKLGDRRASVAK